MFLFCKYTDGIWINKCRKKAVTLSKLLWSSDVVNVLSTLNLKLIIYYILNSSWSFVYLISLKTEIYYTCALPASPRRPRNKLKWYRLLCVHPSTFLSHLM